MMENKTSMRAALEVVAGPDRGLRFVVPEGESTIGRSSANAMALTDPSLSRQHCRVAFDGANLAIADLDSANGMAVNGVEAKRATLHDGDTVELGESTLAVRIVRGGTPRTSTGGAQKCEVAHLAPPLAGGKTTEDGQARGGTPRASTEGPAKDPASNPAKNGGALDSGARDSGTRDSGARDSGAPIVDLGFERGAGADGGAQAARPNWRPLLWAVAAAAVVAAAASLILRGGDEPDAPQITPVAEPSLLPLRVDYEKVEADAGNIFRYRMALGADRRLAVEIDDLDENRHVRKDAVVAAESVERLARQLARAGMFSLESPAAGISADGSLARRELKMAAGARAACAVVENRVPPEDFAAICELLETFGRNELGIWAMQFPAERLVELAQEAFTRARNLYDQRGIAHGNLHGAAKACQEAMFYLETVEPKPDFFADLLVTAKDAGEELSRRYEERRFRADRAINLKEWKSAADELRTLREMIPDEDDPRNADATRKLLDVERRIGK